jgi:hypothetical protein
VPTGRVRDRKQGFPAVLTRDTWASATTGSCKSIHHVDDYDVVESPFGLFPGAPDLAWDEPAYFLRLGPPFRPNHEVRTGPGIFRAAPLTADLDLLLTCATISEARDATKARRAGSVR